MTAFQPQINKRIFMSPALLERLIEAANQLFDRFWLIVLALLPFMLLYGLIIKLFFMIGTGSKRNYCKAFFLWIFWRKNDCADAGKTQIRRQEIRQDDT